MFQIQLQINLFLNYFKCKLETKETGLCIFLIYRFFIYLKFSRLSKRLVWGGTEKEGGDGLTQRELFLLNYGIYVFQYLEK